MPDAINSDRLRVVLVRVRNPLNVGAAARAMSNFGFSHLRLVNPYGPAFREAQSAVGAGEILHRAQEYRTLAEAVADCSLVVGTTSVGVRNLQHSVTLLEPAARIVRTELCSGNVALLFGSEKTGLKNTEFGHCHWLLRIPTDAANLSMNLGQAVAVCLYEMARVKAAAAAESGRDAAVAEDRPADAIARVELMEKFTELLFESLRACNYLRAKSPSATEDKIRRRVRRLKLSRLDAEAWLGILRRMIWKMQSADASSKKE